MKKRFFLLLSVILCGISLSLNAQTLKLHYDFTRSTEGDLTVTDQIGNYNGSLAGGATIVVDANAGWNVLQLNGTSSGKQYVDMDAGALIKTLDNFTIATYIYATEGPYNFLWSFSNSLNCAQTTGKYIGYINSAGRYGYSAAGWGSEKRVSGAPNSPLYAWHYIVFTQSNGVGEIFVNGAKVSTATTIDANMTPKKLFESESAIYTMIGLSPFSGDAPQKAKIADFKIYDGGMTTSQIEALTVSESNRLGIFMPISGKQYLIKNVTYNKYLDYDGNQQALLADKDEVSLSQRFTFTEDRGLINKNSTYPLGYNAIQVSSSKYLRRSSGNASNQGFAYFTTKDTWTDNFVLNFESTATEGEFKMCSKYSYSVVNMGGTLTIQANRYFCKNQSDNNLRSIITGTEADVWVIEEASNIVPSTQLDNAMTKVDDYMSLVNLSQIQESGAAELLGQYTYTAYQNLLTALADAQTYLDNHAVYYVEEISAQSLAVENALNAFISSYKIEINTFAAGEYLIRKTGSNLYWTNMKAYTNEEKPQFKELYNENIDEQFWTVSLDGGRYKVVNQHVDVFNEVSYNRFITENGGFPQVNGTIFRSYSAAYNTFNFYYNGSSCAITRAGSASAGFWRLDANNLITLWPSATLNPLTDFVFEFVDMNTALSEAVTTGRTAFNAATRGYAIGEYVPSVYNAFSNALAAASVIVTAGTATSQNLIAFKAAENLFIANTSSVDHLVVEAGASVSANDYVTGDIVFKSNDASGAGQLTDIPAGGLAVNGLVILQKTVSAKKWYPIGFPVELATIYCDEFKEGEDAGKLDIYDGTIGDFWLRTYDGTSFIYSSTIDKDKGCVIQFPTVFNNKEVLFISAPDQTLYNQSTISGLDDTYQMIASPSVANMSLLDGKTNGLANSHYYVYTILEESNVRYSHSEGSTNILKPFESVIAINVTGGAPVLKSIGMEGNETGLEEVNVANDPIIEVHYYNLQGIEIPKPVTNGIYLVKKVYESRNVEIVKTFINKK